ncbi:MAG: hypothetical protein COW73_00090 [Nitrospirae bacterium CG18_big_fil_WC_8_21_14_2_50_70_55]|nr:hypothetical protein [Deltaproteobacteria bacterium]OIP65625.1 MAG: hypothetical protein AUK30_04185 [Nitrospirae bacterium CG2_30_70_394]PIQ07315.1 MAG: hypothetical protein COW73_00090 [Nitrospirae bacterium CG18_big_fil_WC_8_21_14_2_50_70_55]PIU80253.1 MAG: hypothetical protein COS73_00150 [Nitrospirae bacterium CG06_land_8_20_14_3_00_70_43]PIW82709.1 MAG: hypothetical protein COZ96_07255 [Nitrospirae bacterium CG_4_8_14_3_um_filter_70_85]PIX83085.1 MAG: hypothetical protein COZ33_07335 
MNDDPQARFACYLDTRQAWVEEALVGWLPHGHPRPLFEAMERLFAASRPRLYPLAVIAAAEAVGGDGRACLGPAIAVEIAHRACYRHHALCTGGDAALQLLAGDALLALAFDLLADPAGPPAAAARLMALHDLARCAGGGGAAAGEAVVRLARPGETLTLPELEFIDTHTTGAWFTTAVRIGALLGGGSAAALEALTRYAHHAGLAVAIRADLQGEATVEPPPRPSYARAVGPVAARALGLELVERAVADLAPLGSAAAPLGLLGGAVVEGAH